METSMEPDELKHIWQALGRQLERQEAINLQLFREKKLERARGSPVRIGKFQKQTVAASLKHRTAVPRDNFFGELLEQRPNPGDVRQLVLLNQPYRFHHVREHDGGRLNVQFSVIIPWRRHRGPRVL